MLGLLTDCLRVLNSSLQGEVVLPSEFLILDKQEMGGSEILFLRNIRFAQLFRICLTMSNVQMWVCCKSWLTQPWPS